MFCIRRSKHPAQDWSRRNKKGTQELACVPVNRLKKQPYFTSVAGGTTGFVGAGGIGSVASGVTVGGGNGSTGGAASACGLATFTPASPPPSASVFGCSNRTSSTTFMSFGP